MKYSGYAWVLTASLMFSVCLANPPGHPRLLITQVEADGISNRIKSSPTFMENYLNLRSNLDQRLKIGIDVPIPKDAGGGYTHEQHKRNYVAIHDAGLVYQLSGDKVYAQYAKELLLRYAALYPSLDQHPEKKEQAPGKLFWQSLNESVWLVYSIQGFDAIIETLSPEEIELIENKLFRPMASFLSEGSAQTFNKIHNHGTWAAAAVGMTGYVLGDQEMVNQALYGLDQSGNAGFYKQMDRLFSPDGYYSEGPYYQRYALMPFLLFAKAIENNEPGRQIFSYRDQILLKAVYAAIQLSYNGLFFPINDAIKDKGLDTIELVYGVAIAYGLTQDPALLSIAQQQGRTILSADGFELAKAIDEGYTKPFPYRSQLFRDGPSGEQGALGILRSDQQALILKATAQGMGHGHFDKLNWLFYDNGHELVSDYGAARFLNVVSKNGGHYLPENQSWAKQTIAHNTLVVDERSHFNDRLSLAEQHHPVQLLFDLKDHVQVMAASMSGAYPDVEFTRTLAMIDDPSLDAPVVLDVLKVNAGEDHQYDLPLHFQGQITNINRELEANTQQWKPLGKANGYQHLWLRAKTMADAGTAQLSWLKDNRFYTYSALVDDQTQLILTETGANDPHFNLRRESALIVRVPKAKTHTFVALLEPHGEYNGTKEFTLRSNSQIKALQRMSQNGLDLITVSKRDGSQWSVAISYNPDSSMQHQLLSRGREYTWQGYYRLFDLNGEHQ